MRCFGPVLFKSIVENGCDRERSNAARTLLQLPVSHVRRECAERACVLAFGRRLQEHAGALKKCQNAKWPSDAFSDSPCTTRACVNLAPVCGLVVLSVCAELTARAHAESLCVCLYVCGMFKVFAELQRIRVRSAVLGGHAGLRRARGNVCVPRAGRSPVGGDTRSSRDAMNARVRLCETAH